MTIFCRNIRLLRIWKEFQTEYITGVPVKTLKIIRYTYNQNACMRGHIQDINGYIK